MVLPPFLLSLGSFLAKVAKKLTSSAQVTVHVTNQILRISPMPQRLPSVTVRTFLLLVMTIATAMMFRKTITCAYNVVISSCFW